MALRPLKKLYGDVAVADFGPRALKTIGQEMINRGTRRSHVNKNVGRVKRLFKWGTSEELVPASIYHALQSVTGLKRGRTEARESAPVRPVPFWHVHAIKPFVSRQIWSVIALQILTGARPGELLTMRMVDLDMSGQVWLYSPQHHKTSCHGHRRVIFFGPKGQAVLRPFMQDRTLDAFLFTPQVVGKRISNIVGRPPHFSPARASATLKM